MELLEIGFKPTIATATTAGTITATLAQKSLDSATYGSDIPPRILVEEGDKIVAFYVVTKTAVNGVNGSMNLGAYVTDEITNSAVGLPLVTGPHLLNVTSNTADWYHIDVDIDLTPFIGEYIKPAMGSQTGITRYFKASGTNSTEFQGSGANLPNPFLGGSNASNTNLLYMVIERNPPVVETDTNSREPIASLPSAVVPYVRIQ